ncbi:hypothetical protein Hypma_012567 [Hypsizygus marmoreus]|uniref:DUF6697 domain-containing protein n=1 Tax=Hypsizygus marmoreus TaxID=39966 RepID=A0A369JIN6_HYPMA|nr:hypothetical protein Hypma_012567 [Hypsizygus marmoreus]
MSSFALKEETKLVSLKPENDAGDHKNFARHVLEAQHPPKQEATDAVKKTDLGLNTEVTRGGDHNPSTQNLSFVVSSLELSYIVQGTPAPERLGGQRSASDATSPPRNSGHNDNPAIDLDFAPSATNREPLNSDLQGAPLRDATNRPKRRRIIMDAVEVPTLESIIGDQNSRNIEAEDKKWKQIHNPAVKKKEGLTLSEDTVRARIRVIGFDLYPIPLDKAILDFTVKKPFMCHQYGGNLRNTFPKSRAELLAVHGLDDFMYPNLLYNPHAPQVPGAPGLYYSFRPLSEHWAKPQRVLSGIAKGIWQYQGQYELAPAKPFTKEEWASCNKKDTWTRDVHKKVWGRPTRARIALRARYGRDPTAAELEEALEAPRKYDEVTPSQINQALLTGAVSMNIWTMKCVGYDTQFQLNLVEKFPTWVPPPPSAKKSTEKTTTQHPKKEGRPLNSKAGQKRKHVEAESEDEDEDEPEDDFDSEPEPEEPVYRSRGTRSRPIVL